jgi:hypothetical protein
VDLARDSLSCCAATSSAFCWAWRRVMPSCAQVK